MSRTRLSGVKTASHHSGEASTGHKRHEGTKERTYAVAADDSGRPEVNTFTDMTDIAGLWLRLQQPVRPWKPYLKWGS